MDFFPNPGRLPRLVNEPADCYTGRRPAWLEAVLFVRQATYRSAIRGRPADDTDAVASAIDDLIGRHLMLQFVHHRSALPPAILDYRLCSGAFTPAWVGEQTVLPVDSPR